MRIVNREEFLSMPPGTVFRKFEPSCFDELMVKHETIGNDFYVQAFDWIEADGTDEEQEVYEKALADSKYEFKVDFNAQIRDGLFEDDQLFAVYNKNEVLELGKIIMKLSWLELIK